MTPEELRRIVARNLRAAIEKNGMRVSSLARITGITRQTIYNVLDAKVNIELCTAHKLCGALNISVQELIDANFEQSGNP